jgi:glycosyltransferase involved in cell wall biosynthesis
MRIGIFAQPAFQRQQTGVGGYTTGLIKALLSLETDDLFFLYYRRTQERTIAASGFNDRRVRLRGLIFPEIDQRPRWWWDFYLPVRLKMDRLDAFHSPTHFNARTSIPSVVTIHDLAYYFMKVKGEGLDNYLRGWTQRSMERAERIIAVSDSTANDCHSQGIAQQKVQTIYQGFTNPFDELNEQPAIDFPGPSHLLQNGYLLFMGTVQPRKNLVYLVEEYARVADQIPWDLVMAGAPGESQSEVHAAIAKHGLSERVHLLGFVSDQQRRALYRHASLFVYPSRYEGFGLVVLEAMACGVPVLAANNSSLPEAVGDAGLLVDVDMEGAWAMALKQLYDDQDARQAMIQRGYQHVRQFTWQRCAEQTLAVYRSVAEQC